MVTFMLNKEISFQHIYLNDFLTFKIGISNEMREKISIDYKLLQEFPGPLVKEHTSKAQLIQFCQKNIRECLSNANVNLIDPQSHALLWDFLALLVRQNGIVDLKTDISSLLLSGNIHIYLIYINICLLNSFITIFIIVVNKIDY